MKSQHSSFVTLCNNLICRSKSGYQMPTRQLDEDNQLPDAIEEMRRVHGLRYGVLDELLGYALRRAQNALYIDFYRATSDFALSPQRFAALVLIGENTGIRQTVLSEAMGIARSGGVRLTDWFESRKLVERREEANDARVWGLHLTLKGRRLLDAMNERVRAHDRALIEALGVSGANLKQTLQQLETVSLRFATSTR
jgi:DNA-binding MarR family transcriptional regulator